MILNTSEHAVPEELGKSVLHAITGALREEKEPFGRRLVKIFCSTLLCAAILGVPFFLSFKEQLNWIWTLALGAWMVCLGIGFSLYFHPQPRLVVSGFWSPMIFARLLLVSTMATLVQILVCPSFVFLNSPIEWNPLTPATEYLMRAGGMNLCMLFCGFFFSAVAGISGLGSVWRVLHGSGFRRLPAISAILLFAQLPVVLVQVISPDLRPFLFFWLLGLVSGSMVAVALGWIIRCRPGR